MGRRLYDRFKAERRQPFDDLLARCRPIPGGRAVDLGCGTGELTAELHRALGAARTTGIDSSPAMLERARSLGRPGLDFSLGDLGAWDGPPVDLVVANASLHWVSDHPSLLAQLRGGLAPGGQLAFQVPANFDHPSHTLARRVAAEPPFAQALGASAPADRGDSVLSPTAYAEVLHALGAVEQSVAPSTSTRHLAQTRPTRSSSGCWGTLLTPSPCCPSNPACSRPSWSATARPWPTRWAPGARTFYAFPRIVCWARFP